MPSLSLKLAKYLERPELLISVTFSHISQIEKIYNKSLNSKLSEHDIKTLKESEKRFEEFIENQEASKIIKEIKKRI